MVSVVHTYDNDFELHFPKVTLLTLMFPKIYFVFSYSTFLMPLPVEQNGSCPTTFLVLFYDVSVLQSYMVEKVVSLLPFYFQENKPSFMSSMSKCVPLFLYILTSSSLRFLFTPLYTSGLAPNGLCVCLLYQIKSGSCGTGSNSATMTVPDLVLEEITKELETTYGGWFDSNFMSLVS